MAGILGITLRSGSPTSCLCRLSELRPAVLPHLQRRYRRTIEQHQIQTEGDFHETNRFARRVISCHRRADIRGSRVGVSSDDGWTRTEYGKPRTDGPGSNATGTDADAPRHAVDAGHDATNAGDDDADGADDARESRRVGQSRYVRHEYHGFVHR